MRQNPLLLTPEAGFVPADMPGLRKAAILMVMIGDEADRHLRLTRIDAATAQQIDTANSLAREEQRRPRNGITLAPEALERYVGYYASSFGPAKGEASL